MNLFIRYLKSKYKEILIFLSFSVIFIISFLLYRISVSAVLYPLAVCSLVGIVLLITDFFKTKSRYDSLKRINSFETELENFLPAPENICEEEYNRIISLFQSETCNIKAQSFKSFNEMIDYYTVWVHQIKTPISSMKLAVQSEDSEFSRKINSDLFRIQSYVDMVLAFLRIGSDSTDFLFKNYSLDSIIKQSVKKFAPEFIGKKLSLKYEKTNSEVITDEKWLSFVIEQLLSNAIKYTQKGFVEIYMPDSRTLCIGDTGIGISETDIPRIFEKGYTGHNGRIEKSSSGLGLYLCKRICEGLGIEISISSEVLKGTKVFLKFPQRKQHTE